MDGRRATVGDGYGRRAVDLWPKARSPTPVDCGQRTPRSAPLTPLFALHSLDTRHSTLDTFFLFDSFSRLRRRYHGT